MTHVSAVVEVGATSRTHEAAVEVEATLTPQTEAVLSMSDRPFHFLAVMANINRYQKNVLPLELCSRPNWCSCPRCVAVRDGVAVGDV